MLSRYIRCFCNVNVYCNSQPRTTMKISTLSQLNLKARKRSEQNMIKGVSRSRSSSFSGLQFKLEVAKGDGEELGISGYDEGGSHGNGMNGSGNGNNDDCHNDNGNNDEANDKELQGVEWWWWWKWQQSRHHSQTTQDNIFDLWPVDTAVRVVTNGVKETIQPAVCAIVLGPIRQHVTVQGFFLLLVLGAFVMSCLQVFAGLAMVSTGVSLAGLSGIVLCLIMWPWKDRPSRGQRKNGDDDNAEL